MNDVIDSLTCHAPPFSLQAPELEKKQQNIAKLMSFMPLHILPPKLFRGLYTATDRLLGIRKIALPRVIDSTILLDVGASSDVSLKVRAYYPVFEGANVNQSVKLKTLVYFHGGGCVIGSINSHDRFCRYLAKHSNMNIISVGYRLAPEHKFPVPLHDAIAAWNYIRQNHDKFAIDPEHIGVGGDSAGAYLASIIGLRHLQVDLPVSASAKPAFQFLLYPMFDLQGLTDSYHQFDKQLLLTRPLVDYFRKHYLNSLEQSPLPLVSPLQADDLSESPKSYILTLGYDPLRDDGLAYVERLKSAKITVHHEHYDDSMHGFISVASVSERAQKAVQDAALALHKFNDA